MDRRHGEQVFGEMADTYVMPIEARNRYAIGQKAAAFATAYGLLDFLSGSHQDHKWL